MQSNKIKNNKKSPNYLSGTSNSSSPRYHPDELTANNSSNSTEKDVNFFLDDDRCKYHQKHCYEGCGRSGEEVVLTSVAKISPSPQPQQLHQEQHRQYHHHQRIVSPKAHQNYKNEASSPPPLPPPTRKYLNRDQFGENQQEHDIFVASGVNQDHQLQQHHSFESIYKNTTTATTVAITTATSDDINAIARRKMLKSMRQESQRQRANANSSSRMSVAERRRLNREQIDADSISNSMMPSNKIVSDKRALNQFSHNADANFFDAFGRSVGQHKQKQKHQPQHFSIESKGSNGSSVSGPAYDMEVIGDLFAPPPPPPCPPPPSSSAPPSFSSHRQQHQLQHQQQRQQSPRKKTSQKSQKQQHTRRESVSLKELRVKKQTAKTLSDEAANFKFANSSGSDNDGDSPLTTANAVAGFHTLKDGFGSISSLYHSSSIHDSSERTTTQQQQHRISNHGAAAARRNSRQTKNGSAIAAAASPLQPPPSDVAAQRRQHLLANFDSSALVASINTSNSAVATTNLN
mmetsp:Transcript_13239/g.16152  ORF Transcript_13239/g.16152 Transcript_13239/m.16152 type:complete len:518 (-) Transcript_13239:31-1584(-)